MAMIHGDDLVVDDGRRWLVSDWLRMVNHGDQSWVSEVN